jgi:hypothetical protein
MATCSQLIEKGASGHAGGILRIFACTGLAALPAMTLII